MTENPYETSLVAVNPADDWEINDGDLYCTQTVTLPEICYATLATEGLRPRDMRVKYVSALGVGLAITSSLGGWVATEFIQGFSWRAIVVGGVVGFALMQGVNRLTEITIRIRLYESKEKYRQRRATLRKKRLLTAIAVLVSAGSLWVMLESQMQSIPVLVFCLSALGFGLPDFIGLKGSLALFATQRDDSDGQYYRLLGLSPEYIAALATMQTNESSP